MQFIGTCLMVDTVAETSRVIFQDFFFVRPLLSRLYLANWIAECNAADRAFCRIICSNDYFGFCLSPRSIGGGGEADPSLLFSHLVLFFFPPTANG